MTDTGLGFDVYTVRARVAPALLTAAPALALGVAVLPLLPGAHKLWSLLAVGLSTYAASTARKAGNRVQPELFRLWGGTPTTKRLRYRDNASSSEVSRRHKDVERVLGGGLRLPMEKDERSDPEAADAEYSAAARRIIHRVRNDPAQRLLNIENRNYGFARNLYGLKPIGLWCAGGAFSVSAVLGTAMGFSRSWSAASFLLLPALASVVAVVLWRQVDADFVRPQADAYADRFIEAVEQLASR
jgi:hypothetical protein